MVRGGERALVPHVNVHCLNLGYHRPWSRELPNGASVVFREGSGACSREDPAVPRPSEVHPRRGGVAAGGSRRGKRSLPILSWGPARGRGEGRRPAQGEDSRLEIVGVHHGYFDRTLGNPENEAVIQEVNAANPDVLVVGFGMPLQKLWLKEKRDRLLNTGVTVTLGGVFDYVSRELRRGPRFLPTTASSGWPGSS